MKTNDKMTLNTILQHKDYFDKRLIDIILNLSVSNDVLTTSNSKYKNQLQDYKKNISQLNFKIKDLNVQKDNLEQKYIESLKEKEKLIERINKLGNEIEKIIEENEKKQQEINEQLKQNKEIIKKYNSIIKKYQHANSTNSNMPSSFDVLGHTKTRTQTNTRIKTDKKRGGQKNHPLHKSKLSENADYVRKLYVKKAPSGAIPKMNEEGNIEYYVTQEVDLTLKSIITETRYYIDENAEDLAKADNYAINPVVYSNHFKAAVVYLNQRGTIPLQRLCDMIADISKGSVQLRAGTLSKWCKECSKKSEEQQNEILKDILDKPIVHVDETGMKVNAEQYWIQTITNEKGAAFFMTKRRGDEEKGAIGHLKTYNGTIIHDHFKPYQKLQCKHAECNAHIDRYLKNGIEFDKSKECKELLELMHNMLKRKRKLIDDKKANMPEEEIKAYEAKYEEILNQGLKNYYAKNEGIQKKYEPEYIKTFKRMLEYKDDHLRFITDFEIPYTNNAAERQCRAVKAKKKSSGQFVSESSGKAYVGILSLLQTARIKNENALEALERVFR